MLPLTNYILRRNFILLEENNSQLKDKIEFQKDEIARLKNEVLQMSGQVGSLTAELDMLRAETTFSLREGIAFRKDISGRVEPEPYCPKCHEILSTVDYSIYICGSCSYVVNLRKNLSDIVSSFSEEQVN